MTTNRHRADRALPELVWPDVPPTTPVPLTDSYARRWAMGVPTDVRLRDRRGRRGAALHFLAGAVLGALLAVMGMSAAHAYQQHRQTPAVVPSRHGGIPAGVPVLRPTDLPGLLGAGWREPANVAELYVYGPGRSVPAGRP